MKATLENRRKIVIESSISPFKRKNIFKKVELHDQKLKKHKTTRKMAPFIVPTLV